MSPQPEFVSIFIVICSLVRRHGNPPSPIYVAVLNLDNGSDLQIGVPKLRNHRVPPYPTGPQALLVTIEAEDLACLHLALGWRLPERVIDLAVEFRNTVNGQAVPGGTGMAGALIWYGLPASTAIVRGDAPEYVRQRIHTIARLFDRMRSSIDWGRALLRGRYLNAVAKIETTGIPVDTLSLEWVTSNWARVRSHLTETGYIDGFSPDELPIGYDARNRFQLRPLVSRTGRNQPKSRNSILDGPAWTRFFVQPKPGNALAIIDWQQQEFGIAAALSGDIAMQRSYEAGDPYLDFAIASGSVPENATAESHPEARARFKACALGVQYGMGYRTLARRLSISATAAEKLLALHRRTYPKFWAWSDETKQRALLSGQLQSVFGWQIAVDPDANPRFLRNFPMQANAAEMLRLACCLVTESGIRICATLHDAILIEARQLELDSAIAETQRLMMEASRIVLDGFTLRSDVRSVRYPEHLGDERGNAIWQMIKKLIEERSS